MVTLDDIWLKLDILDDLISTCAELKKRQLTQDRKISDLSSENLNLKSQIEQVNTELDRFKQEALNTNLELAGIPVSDSEVPVEIASSIFSHLGFKDEKIIKSAYRKKGYNTRAGLPPTIIVTIENKGIRDQILKTKRQHTLDTSIIETTNLAQDTNTPRNKRLLYINEHLTDINKYIFKRAKDLRRCGTIFGAWVRNGYIIIREKENSDIQRITNLSQLDGFHSQH